MNGEKKLYPIAEIFTSPQGEGCFVGQMQTFIRLAGCTVGKPYKKEMYGMGKHKLPIYTEQCTLYDDRTFACDTDYRTHERFTVEQIFQKIPDSVDNVCITGGEPMMHDLTPLITALVGIGRKVHIETSGTIWQNLSSDIWVTCSPKVNVNGDMLDRADELKILVDREFYPERLVETSNGDTYSLLTMAHEKPVFLQPVNGEKDLSSENLVLCLNWQRHFPQFRISLQMHKVMNHYLQTEVVR